MNPRELHALAKQLFGELLELSDHEREGRLDELANSNPALAAEVTSLLANIEPDTDHLAPKIDGRPDAIADLLDGGGTDAVEPTQFESGDAVSDRFRILRKLGSGGMGDVWAAQDEQLDEEVALKFIRFQGGAAQADQWKQRFLAEVRAARQVTHPNVCRVHDVGESGEQVFLSMELVDGVDLTKRIRQEGPLPRAKAVQLARELSSALAAIHAAGLLHRDLKPANILFDSKGAAKVSDFGLASKATDSKTTKHDSGSRSGTRSYMAPEIQNGGHPSQASDVFALGLVLYEAVTGRRAFRTGLAICEAARQGNEPRSPSSFPIKVDPILERVIKRCLAFDPEARPPSAATIADVLAMDDALDAMLALGENPTPEVISDSTARGLVSRRQGLLLIAICWLIILVSTYLDIGGSLHRLPPTPPAAAAAAARTKLDAAIGLGPSQPTTAASYFEVRQLPAPDGFSYARDHYPTPGFWHREAHKSLSPLKLATLFDDLGQTQIDDPTDSERSALTLIFNLDGTPVRMTDMRPDPLVNRVDPAINQAPEASIDALFELLHFERDLFKPTAATTNSLAAFDGFNLERQTWIGPDQERLELVLSGPRIRAFEVLWPFIDDDPIDLSIVLANIVLVTLLLLAIPFSIRHFRRAQGDIVGVLRLTLVIFASTACSAYCFADWPLDPLEPEALLGFVLAGFLLGFYLALLTWILFMAVEPLVQRFWPRSLVTWTRILHGRFRDRLVASHVLIGLASAAAQQVVFDVMRPMRGLNMDSSLLSGSDPATWIASLTSMPFMALVEPLEYLTGLVLLRLLLKRRPPAVALIFMIAFSIGSGLVPHLMLSGALIVIFDMFLLLRFGVLPLVVSNMLLHLFDQLPRRFEVDQWYSSAALVLFATIALTHVACLRGLKPARTVPNALPSNSGRVGVR